MSMENMQSEKRRITQVFGSFIAEVLSENPAFRPTIVEHLKHLKLLSPDEQVDTALRAAIALALKGKKEEAAELALLFDVGIKKMSLKEALNLITTDKMALAAAIGDGDVCLVYQGEDRRVRKLIHVLAKETAQPETQQTVEETEQAVEKPNN
jgi:acylphosphatase